MLLDGTSVDSSAIDFDPNSYHFNIGGNDITELIRRADKRTLVPGFDDDVENKRIFGEKYANDPNVNTGELDTSVAGNFWHQITTDPLGAPLDALDAGVKKLANSSGIQKVVIIGVVGLIIYAFVITRRRG